MVRLILASLLVLGSAGAHAQPTQPPLALQPSVDSPEVLMAMRSLSLCLAESRPRWARQTLAQPYLSDAQARVAAESLSGRDTCVRGDTEFTFRTSTVVGTLAEQFVRAEIGQVEFDRLAISLDTVEPLNASEDFALCVASRNPAAARDLALSEFGSSQEMEAARQLAGHLAPCMRRGEDLTVDLQALRALMSTALYRGMSSLRTEAN